MCRLRRILLFMCIFLSMHSYGMPLSRIDSLVEKCEQAKEDTVKMNLYTTIAGAYNDMGYANDKALDAANSAMAIAKKINNKGVEIIAYLCIGNYYQLKGDAKEALDNFLKAQDIAERHKDKRMLAMVYDKLNLFYSSVMKNYKTALEYSQKDIKLMKEAGDKRGYAVALSNTGNIYYYIDSSKQALKYYLQAMDVFNSLHLDNSLADVENNIGSVYTDLKQYDDAIDYYQRALTIYQKLNNKYGIAMCYGNIGNVYNEKGDPENGVKYLEEDVQIARTINSKDDIASAYQFLAEGYSKMGNYKKAYDYQLALSNLKDTLFSEESSKQVNDMQVKYDTEKKERENKILELSVNRQKLINYSISVGLILVLALAFFVYRGYVNKKKAHEELAEKNKIIEEKNKDILDSINYAKTIQHAILTPADYLKETLGGYFIVYKPRDVVSGDFYWCHTVGDKVVFTVADCTGHGVPGAFMSMIGNSLLNEVVIENKITNAAEILNALRTGILKTLQQKVQGSVKRDGMDITLCVWDKSKNTIEYAGANCPLYLVRKESNGAFEVNGKVKLHTDDLIEFLPDKQPIGFLEGKTETPFTSYSFSLKKGDIIYLSSDGFADQFGGESGKKYTKKKFRETLSALAGFGLEEQRDRMNKIIDDWKGNEFQTDDICVMGVRFS